MQVFPLFAAVGTAVGICGMQLIRNICINPEVRYASLPLSICCSKIFNLLLCMVFNNRSKLCELRVWHEEFNYGTFMLIVPIIWFLLEPDASVKCGERNLLVLDIFKHKKKFGTLLNIDANSLFLFGAAVSLQWIIKKDFMASLNFFFFADKRNHHITCYFQLINL